MILLERLRPEWHVNAINPNFGPQFDKIVLRSDYAKQRLIIDPEVDRRLVIANVTSVANSEHILLTYHEDEVLSFVTIDSFMPVSRFFSQFCLCNGVIKGVFDPYLQVEFNWGQRERIVAVMVVPRLRRYAQWGWDEWKQRRREWFPARRNFARGYGLF